MPHGPLYRNSVFKIVQVFNVWVLPLDSHSKQCTKTFCAWSFKIWHCVALLDRLTRKVLSCNIEIYKKIASQVKAQVKPKESKPKASGKAKCKARAKAWRNASAAWAFCSTWLQDAMPCEGFWQCLRCVVVQRELVPIVPQTHTAPVYFHGASCWVVSLRASIAWIRLIGRIKYGSLVGIE